MTKWIPGQPSFADAHPNLLTEWSWLENPFLDPSRVTPASNQWAVWRCKEHGHYHRARISEKARYPKCGVCDTKIVLAGFNDFASRYPELVQYWDDLLNPMTPSEVAWGSNQQVLWKCDQGHSHSWLASMKAFGTEGKRCHYCTKYKKKVLPGFNDIGTVAPQLIPEWDWDKNGGIDPFHTLAFPKKDCDWKCELGHTWQAGARRRALRGDSCPTCAGRVILPGFNDFATLFPELLVEWDYSRNIVDPTTLSPGRIEKFWWICHLKGHSWKALLSNRTKVNAGCPKCSNHISKQETKVFKLLQQQFPNILQDVPLEVQGRLRRTMRADMHLVLEATSLVVEYDGAYYHTLQPERDMIKTQALLAMGHKIIRLREEPLEDVELSHSNLAQVSFPEGQVEVAAALALDQLLVFLGS